MMPRQYTLKHTLEEKFWEKVVKDADPDGCWLWTGCTTRAGYGIINQRGKIHYTHRLSYEIHYGPIPEGMEVCHGHDEKPCVSRACVNPAHLYAGTHAENMHDMIAHGTSRAGTKNVKAARGEANHSKLTEVQVLEIRAKYKPRVYTQQMLADEYRVHLPCINAIILRKNWTHI